MGTSYIISFQFIYIITFLFYIEKFVHHLLVKTLVHIYLHFVDFCIFICRGIKLPLNCCIKNISQIVPSWTESWNNCSNVQITGSVNNKQNSIWYQYVSKRRQNLNQNGKTEMELWNFLLSSLSSKFFCNSFVSHFNFTYYIHKAYIKLLASTH